MAGRKQDPIWLKFHKKVELGKKGCFAECKACGKQMQGLVVRMKTHVLEKCAKIENDQLVDSNVTVQLKRHATSSIEAGHADESVTAAKITRPSSTLKNYITTTYTSAEEKEQLDLQVARTIYGTNSPFSIVDHPEFIKLTQLLRPKYNPPNRKAVGGTLLDKVNDECELNMAVTLKGKSVCLALDGWSNVHREPIVCTTVSDSHGNVFMIESTDTTGHSHTAEYLQEIALQSVTQCEKKYGCIVRSFVTDNAATVTKLRREVTETENNRSAQCQIGLISYGCSAHILNLLAQDLKIEDIKSHVEIIKYFRNNHALLLRTHKQVEVCLHYDYFQHLGWCNPN